MTLPVAHYLDGYRLKQRLMNAGTTSPSPEGRAFINAVVAYLSTLDPALPCDLAVVRDGGRVRAAFLIEGKEVAAVELPSEDEQSG